MRRPVRSPNHKKKRPADVLQISTAPTSSNAPNLRNNPYPPSSLGASKKSKQEVGVPPILKHTHTNRNAVGMDVEGIYRKSGGNSQVQAVRDSFERNSPDFDLSDPDLDIHAVTSGLKQYFRKLPVPLITYDVYDALLETTSIPSDSEDRIEAMRAALRELPNVHYDVLEYLMQHLRRVVEREKENLMSSMNVAVVFAPTIMRPESLGRELTDTKNKNEAVMWMVENVPLVFAK